MCENIGNQDLLAQGWGTYLLSRATWIMRIAGGPQNPKILSSENSAFV